MLYKVGKLLNLRREGSFRVFRFMGIEIRMYSRKYAVLDLNDKVNELYQKLQTPDKQIEYEMHNMKAKIELINQNMININETQQQVEGEIQKQVLLEKQKQENLESLHLLLQEKLDDLKLENKHSIEQQLEKINKIQDIVRAECLKSQHEGRKIQQECFDLKNQVVSLHRNSVLHLSAYTIHNAGDNILVTSLRDSIEKVFDKPLTWVKKNVRDKLDDETVMLANNTNGIIIGGGGLFLKDTNANDISGWQWPCPINELDKLKVPVYYLALGYNRFRGQDEFDEAFYKNINQVVKQATFFGMRNTGSVRAIQNYLNEDLKKKVVFHPCATTILSKLYQMPDLRGIKPFIAVNCAFDRSEMRFGSKKIQILETMARTLKKLSVKYKIKYYAHMVNDEEILPYFDKEQLEYECIKLNKELDTDDFLRVYSSPALVWAVRGHAQLIPFGCGTPTLSIITHDKLKWFLEDVNHPEWGVDICSLAFEEELYNKSLYMLENSEKIKQEIAVEKERLWEITMDNLNSISLGEHI